MPLGSWAAVTKALARGRGSHAGPASLPQPTHSLFQSTKNGASFFAHLRVKGKGIVSFYQILFSLSGALAIDWPVLQAAGAALASAAHVCRLTDSRPLHAHPARARPDWLDHIFSYLNLFMLDFPSLPFVGCVSQNNFVNSLYTSAALPACFVLMCALLCCIRAVDPDNAWRWAIYVLYL